MDRIRLRLDLQPAERQSLERLAREQWRSWRLSQTAPGDSGQGSRTDALIIETDEALTRIGCLAVELPHHGEAFRLHIDSQQRESTRDPEQPPVSLPPLAQGVEALDVGRSPQLFLVWRTHDYPDEGIASIRGMVVNCADALLIRGPERQLLVQVSRVPTWLTLAVDDESIEAVIAAAQEIELLV